MRYLGRWLRALVAVALVMSLGAIASGRTAALAARAAAAPTPIDPQRVQDQQDMTWNDYRPIPGVSWATNGAVPTQRPLRVALVAVDFDNQPFVITQPKWSDPFGNPQLDPVSRDQVPGFYADFFNKPSPVNHFQTINGYWMEQSGGKVGVSSVTAFGPYRMPKKSYQYGLNDIGQNPDNGDSPAGCPAQTTATGAQDNASTIAVGSSAFFYAGDVVTIRGVSGRRTVTAVPDGTHLTLSAPVTVTDGAALNDCAGTSLETDADALWHADAGCTGRCGFDVVLRIYAGYDETSVWQEFGDIKFQTPDDIPREPWGNPNQALPNTIRSRYVPSTSWLAGSQLWGQSTVRQGESSGTITHELSHFLFSIGDNNNNPYVPPFHRVGSGPWDIMDRGSFNGPGGPHNRWEVPAQFGASMPGEHMLRNKIGMGFVPPANVLRLSRDGLAASGLAVVDVIARAVNTGPLPAGSVAGVQVVLDGGDHDAACDVGADPMCDGGGWHDYTIENVQRIGYGSFEPDNGVLIAKNKDFPPGGRSAEGSSCGYNCFTWVEDAHPEDIDQVDYTKPDGTPVKRTVGDYRQLNDALFHAGTNSGSTNEYVDAANGLHLYVLGLYNDAKGLRHYVIGVQNPAGAGPQTRGVAVAGGARTGNSPNCSFPLTNTGVDAPTDPALHPQDERAFLHSDIYRLSVSAQGAGWSAQLANNLATAAFGQTVKVPVHVSPGSAPAGRVRLTAISVSDPAKTATATCTLRQR